MRRFIFCPGTPPETAIGVQVLFQPTRSFVTPTEAPASPLKVLVRQPHSWLVTTTWLDRDRIALMRERPLIIDLSFDGAPLQFLGLHWLFDESCAINPDDIIKAWMQCRLDSLGKPGQRMFHEMDRRTGTLMLPMLPAPEAARTGSAVTQVSPHLLDRVRDRAVRTGPTVPRASIQADFEHIDCVLQACIDIEFAGNIAGAALAFEHFAAGLLRQECRVDHPSLNHHRIVACDADSAFVFYFAEFAGMAAAYGTASAARWNALLPSLVLMQELYLARFLNPMCDPRCFRDYGVNMPRVLSTAEFAAIKASFAARNSPADLEARLLANARHVAHRGHAGCFA